MCSIAANHGSARLSNSSRLPPPHLGAPLALARVLGQDSALGISGADFAWMASMTDYPSAYQLLPAPGECVCWDQSDPALRSLDIYDPVVSATLGLKPAQLARAQALHAVLGAGNVPPGVRYFYFAGAGHRTATRLNVFRNAAGAIDLAKSVVTRTEDAGDGTVPMYSALPQRGQRHIAINEHATAFTGDPFHRTFVRLLGGNAGPALEGALGQVLALSVEAPVVPADKDIEVLLHGADEGTGGFTAVDGELVIARVAAGEAIIEDGEEFVPLTVEGRGPQGRYPLCRPADRQAPADPGAGERAGPLSDPVHRHAPVRGTGHVQCLRAAAAPERRSRGGLTHDVD